MARFVAVKLLLTLLGGLIFVVVLAPRRELIGWFVSFVIVDLLLLVPFRRFAARDLSTAARLTVISVASAVVSATLALFLVGGFTHPLALVYFGLIPLALVVIPAPLMVWSSAGLVTLAYVILATLQLAGWIPHLPGTPSEVWRWFLFAGVLLLGLWGEAVLLAIFTFNYETRRRDLERRVYAESMWSTVGKAVISTQDLDQVLTTVIQIINEKMRVETGSILLKEPATDTIVFAKILRGDIEELGAVRMKVGQGIVGWVVASGQSALVPDVARDPRWYAAVDKDTGFVTRSILCVPLIAPNEVIGAIELLNKRDGEFTPADQQLLESIAAPVAIAIQNARLHHRVVAQLDDLTQLFHQVERAKQEWEATVDAIDAGIMLTDERGNILRANDTLARWAKTTSGEMVGQTCWQLVHGTSEPPVYCPHSQMIASAAQAVESEYQDDFLGGTFHTIAYPLRDPNGTFVGSVSVIKDITEEKRLQAQLIQSEKLAATGRLAASLAHEINNPLQGIQGCLELVGVGHVDSEQEQFLSMARQEVTRLIKMVRNMLDFNRASPATPMPVDLQPLLEAVMALTAPTIEKNGIRMNTEWAPALPRINGVEDQLKQVFLNLVLNAVETMPNGGRLDVRTRGLPAEGWVTVSVSDSRDEVAAQAAPPVVKPSAAANMPGTGFGLTVSHSIIATHGGRLTIDHAPGVGNVFTVWLPIPSATVESESPRVDSAERGET